MANRSPAKKAIFPKNLHHEFVADDDLTPEEHERSPAKKAIFPKNLHHEFVADDVLTPEEHERSPAKKAIFPKKRFELTPEERERLVRGLRDYVDGSHTKLRYYSGASYMVENAGNSMFLKEDESLSMKDDHCASYMMENAGNSMSMKEDESMSLKDDRMSMKPNYYTEKAMKQYTARLDATVEFWRVLLKKEKLPHFPYKYKYQAAVPFFSNLKDESALQKAHERFNNLVTTKMHLAGCSRSDAINKVELEAKLAARKSISKKHAAKSIKHDQKSRKQDLDLQEDVDGSIEFEANIPSLDTGCRIRELDEGIIKSHDLRSEAFDKFIYNYKIKKARRLRVQRCYNFTACMIFFVALWFLCRYLMY